MEHLIASYIEGSTALQRAIAGLSSADLNAPPPPGSSGSWTLQQIVVHVWDSDLIGVHRMRRVIAEQRPLLIGYDETLFARSLAYERMDAALVADAYRSNRLIMGQTLRNLPSDAWERWGVHNEVGRKSLTDLVKSYIEHTDHHMRFVEEKRRLIGKPMN